MIPFSEILSANGLLKIESPVTNPVIKNADPADNFAQFRAVYVKLVCVLILLLFKTYTDFANVLNFNFPQRPRHYTSVYKL